MVVDKVIITNDSGEKVEATAPVIISASRSTDIPAFYTKWFFNHLAKGYCVWYNPFNQQPMYILFDRCRLLYSGQRIQNQYYHIYTNWMKGAYIIIFK